MKNILLTVPTQSVVVSVIFLLFFLVGAVFVAVEAGKKGLTSEHEGERNPYIRSIILFALLILPGAVLYTQNFPFATVLCYVGAKAILLLLVYLICSVFLRKKDTA